MEKRESVKLEQGRAGILGVKAGMSHIYAEDGSMLPVTVIDLRPNVITQVKTKEKDGYEAVQIGFAERTAKSASKPEAGHAKKANAPGFYHYEEFRLPAGAKLDGLEIGKVLSPEAFQVGELVDVTAVSKGKGFQGVMKRHHFRGNYASHGCSVNHRHPGAIGMNRQIGHVPKGRRMAGQMGNVRVTTQNLKVVGLDVEKQVLLIQGSVPGPRSGIVSVRASIKSLARKKKA
ncbi:MAG: 50S ribosomal protein L3 [Bdellovibrionales bacterium]|nr:50S ribosomal protein L3 [Bdellovibrionales bacterium]